MSWHGRIHNSRRAPRWRALEQSRHQTIGAMKSIFYARLSCRHPQPRRSTANHPNTKQERQTGHVNHPGLGPACQLERTKEGMQRRRVKMKTSTNKISLRLLALILGCTNVASQTYTRNSCYTTKNPIQNITFDSVNGTYSITPDQQGTGTRPSTDILFQARACNCADYQNGPYFCPVGLDNCYTYRDWQQQAPLSPPVCTIERSGLVSFAISIAPGLYGLFVIVLTILCCSKRGEFALSYCCNTMARGYANQMYATYLLRRDPELARAMIRRWCLRRWEFVEAQRSAGDGAGLEMAEFDPFAPSRPASLRLRTKCYKPTPSFSGLSGSVNVVHEQNAATADDDTPCCMICFIPLSDGDRIGDLNCMHEFHSSCLKDWLKRKNSCPLCLRQNVAEAVFQDHDG
jgi:hypothetical protein